MADPVSIISLLAISAHSARKLSSLIESIRDAPRDILNISDDAKSICDILFTLDDFLEGNKASELPTEITQSLHVPPKNTCRAADKLVDKIRPLAKEEDESKTSKRVAGIKWSFFQKDVKQLGEQLSNGKSTFGNGNKAGL